MRIDLREESISHRILQLYVDVTLNGQSLERCRMADEERGEALALVSGESELRLLTGRVEITLKPSAPLPIRHYYECARSVFPLPAFRTVDERGLPLPADSAVDDLPPAA